MGHDNFAALANFRARRINVSNLGKSRRTLRAFLVICSLGAIGGRDLKN
jgi:hypothetical protein